MTLVEINYIYNEGLQDEMMINNHNNWIMNDDLNQIVD